MVRIRRQDTFELISCSFTWSIYLFLTPPSPPHSVVAIPHHFPQILSSCEVDVSDVSLKVGAADLFENYGQVRAIFSSLTGSEPPPSVDIDTLVGSLMTRGATGAFRTKARGINGERVMYC